VEFLRENVILVTVAVMVFVFLMTLAVSASKFPYVPTGPLMTAAEMNFYHQLLAVLPKNTVLFTKVRIADVVDVKSSISGTRRIKLFNQIAAKHFDFVVVNRQMVVLAAVELNDSSHNRKDRRERDALVRNVMKSAKIPLFEIKAAKTYNLGEISEWLQLVAVGCIDDKSQHNTITPKQQIKQPEVGNV